MVKLNETYISTTSSPFPMESIHRVVWEAKVENIAVLIRVDKTPFKAPIITTYGQVDDLIGREILKVVELKPHPHHRLSDTQLTEKYPPTHRRIDKITKKRPETSAPVEYRNNWLEVIDQITPHLVQVWRKEKSLYSLIAPVAELHEVAENETYQVLYRFLAAGSVRLSVVSNRIFCGGAGTTRIGNGFHLGRLKTDTKLNNLPNDNFVLTELWLQRIQDTHKQTIRVGVSAGSAWQTFLNLFCSISCTIKDGQVSYKYLPKGDRPSKVQFLTNGPGDDPEEETWRKQLAENEFEKNFRGLDGKSAPITFSTGGLGDVDSSSNDEYLVSVLNPLVGVGTARSLPVVDVSIGYIYGCYVGWRVNVEAAKLAALDAASDKVEKCARYGLTITPDQWHKCLPAKLRGDKGEFNAERSYESLGTLNRSIEFVMTNRPDLRGVGEQTHRRLHDHEADASTHGRNRKRGERDPAIDAHLNIFEYQRKLIRLILYHNNVAPVEHLLTFEMKQHGVKGTRKAILEWSMEMGYHHEVAYHNDDLILELCPEYPAVVTEDGVYPVVRRNGDTGDEILLKELRYLGPYIKKQRWLERARTVKRFRITIRMNPNDPRKVWYQDIKTGLHEFTLAVEDPLIGRLATVQDLVANETAEIGPSSDLADEADLKKAEMKAINEAERKESKKNKKALQVIAKKKNLNSSTGVDRRKNLQAEIAATGQSPIPIVAGTVAGAPTPNQRPQPMEPDRQSEDDVDDLTKQWLRGG
jgi:hypothetical protein